MDIEQKMDPELRTGFLHLPPMTVFWQDAVAARAFLKETQATLIAKQPTSDHNRMSAAPLNALGTSVQTA